jgi:hypothetical protein
MMLFKQGFRYSECFQKILHNLQIRKNLVPCQPFGRRYIPSGRPTIQSIIRPDNENFPSGPSFVSRSFKLFQLASVRTFQKHVRTTFNVWPAIGFLSKTQIWEDRCNRPDDVDSRPDALIHNASITFKIQTSGRQPSWSGRSSIRSNVRTTIHLVRTREVSIWKLCATEVRPWGRQGNTVRTRLKSGKNLSEIFRKPIAQLSIRMPYDYRLDGA